MLRFRSTPNDSGAKWLYAIEPISPVFGRAIGEVVVNEQGNALVGLYGGFVGAGVVIAARLYPGYSHLNQAMSELGAIGAPTHGVSPLINNFRLGVLFIVFGLAAFATFHTSKLAQLSAC